MTVSRAVNDHIDDGASQTIPLGQLEITDKQDDRLTPIALISMSILDYR